MREDLRKLPDTIVESLERLLDRVVARAVENPLDVRSAKQVRKRLEHDGPSSGTSAGWAVALAARSKKSLSLGKRTIPVAVATKVGTELLTSFRLGAYELELLASLLVNRLREADAVVDHRFVQRVTVNAYVSPGRRLNVHRRRPHALAQLAGLWSARVMGVEPAVGRVGKAAELIESLDVRPARPELEAGPGPT
jgi:hypothetical protein